ncbi:MAG: hypothetical protein M1814_004004 [Vezdaea aestivalis]|nr:MAG: hypothetical protein M1814_004004 [Vezdaea aestivalis]
MSSRHQDYAAVTDLAAELCDAIQRDRPRLIQLLVASELSSDAIGVPSPSLTGSRSVTALHYAVELKQKSRATILETLLNRIPQNSTQVEQLGTGQVRRHNLGSSSDDATRIGSEEYTPLCWAALHANVDAVRLLIAKGADVNSQTSFEQESNIADLLLDAGANASLQDANDDTALHLLLARGNASLALRVLNRSQTPVDQFNVYGWSLLHCIARYVRTVDTAKLLNLLIAKGVSLLALNCNGLTALQIAERHNKGVFDLLRFYEQPKANENTTSLSFGERVSSYQPSEAEIKCLKALYTSDYESHKARNPERSPGTCEWVLEHPQYIQWRGQDSGLLWISADPGCGKSVLASFLIDFFNGSESQRAQPTNVCYFFFKDDNEQQNNAVTGLSAILHQFFSINKHLIKHCLQVSEAKGDRFRNELTSMWGILLSATADQASPKTILVIDGLDECGSSSLPDLLQALTNLRNLETGNAQRSQARLKIFVTSRPYVQIADGLDHPLTIRLRGEDESLSTKKDIVRVIESRLNKLAKRRKLSREVRDLLIERLSDGAGQTFLWVSLVLKDLEESLRTSKKILGDLIDRKLPTLDEIYESLLNKAIDRMAARKALYIILGASRPLSLAEMNVAFTVGKDIQKYDNSNEEPDIEATIKNLCGFFVQVIDEKFYFIHHTAREFLLSENSQETVALKQWRQSFDPIESQITLSELCAVYLLSLFMEAKPPDDFRTPGKPKGYYFTNPSFFDYAAEYWAEHFGYAQRRASRYLLDLVNKIYESIVFSTPDEYLPHIYYIVLIRQRCPSRYVPPSEHKKLTYAILAGHETIVHELLREGNPPDRGACCRTCSIKFSVLWAVVSKYPGSLEVLLQHGADIKVKELSGSTPLHIACERGRESDIRCLIANGASLDCTNDSGDTPFHVAIKSRRFIAVSVLLEASNSVEGNTAPKRLDQSGFPMLSVFLK